VITAGRATTVRGLMTKAPYAETELELEARAFGSAAFVPLGQATYRHGVDGAPATLLVRPTRATVYRWVMPEQASTAGAVSPPVTVQVRTVVSLWSPARAAKGRAFRVTGRTTPAKPGTVVTLQRKAGNRWVRVSSGRVARNGTYALTARSRWRTTWTLRVVGGAGSGNLAGVSPTRRVSIS
jgi:hypothetical protein